MKTGERDAWVYACAGKGKNTVLKQFVFKYSFRKAQIHFFLAENLLFCYALM